MLEISGLWDIVSGGVSVSNFGPGGCFRRVSYGMTLLNERHGVEITTGLINSLHPYLVMFFGGGGSDVVCRLVEEDVQPIAFTKLSGSLSMLLTYRLPGTPE